MAFVDCKLEDFARKASAQNGMNSEASVWVLQAKDFARPKVADIIWLTYYHRIT